MGDDDPNVDASEYVNTVRYAAGQAVKDDVRSYTRLCILSDDTTTFRDVASGHTTVEYVDSTDSPMMATGESGTFEIPVSDVDFSIDADDVVTGSFTASTDSSLDTNSEFGSCPCDAETEEWEAVQTPADNGVAQSALTYLCMSCGGVYQPFISGDVDE